MARWLGFAADWLRPIYEHIHTRLMAGGYVQMDETPVEYVRPGSCQTKTRLPLGLQRSGAEVSNNSNAVAVLLLLQAPALAAWITKLE